MTQPPLAASLFHLPSLTYLQPLFPALLLLVILGVVFRDRRLSWRVVAALALFLITWPPVARVQLRILEGRYSAAAPLSQGIQAIVVLASEVLPPSANRPVAIPAWDTYQRCQYAAWLYANGLRVPVVVSGKGSTSGPPYAETMKAVLTQMGVPGEMIWTENRSRSTHENATYVTALLREKGIAKIALVTEAYHMPRAELSFRKESRNGGLDIIPAACCFRSDPDDLPKWLPSAQAIDWNQDCLHEIMGIVWYKIRGRI
jgi:uncharacterized SAM-binding protein YcdF (DUF218 family)